MSLGTYHLPATPAYLTPQHSKRQALPQKALARGTKSHFTPWAHPLILFHHHFPAYLVPSNGSSTQSGLAAASGEAAGQVSRTTESKGLQKCPLKNMQTLNNYSLPNLVISYFYGQTSSGNPSCLQKSISAPTKFNHEDYVT